MAILAPSVITLIESNSDSALFIDFNEEENNQEEKKESNEKDIFLHTWENTTLSLERKSKNFGSTYIEVYYNHAREILLPPPKHNA